MFKILLACKWRKLRMHVWNRRLQNQLNLLSTQMNLSIPCSLHISWAPFFGGSAVLKHHHKKAIIMVQIPYDGHLTANEREVLSTFHISKKELPYFILFHEFYHLLDALSFVHVHKNQMLKTYQESLKKAVRLSANYRKLSFEEKADRFAYEQCRNLFARVS